MNRISKWFIVCLAPVLCCLALACTDEEETKPVEVSCTTPAMPDMAVLDSCGSVVTSFELSSTGLWHLYSDKMWVKFSLQPDGEFLNDIKGVEGEYTVYIKVTDEARTFSESYAKVSLIAGDKTQEVATFVRPGNDYSFALLSSDGDEVQAIEIGTEGTAWVAPAANFDCAILSFPEWISEPEATDGGYTLNVTGEYVPYVKQGVVTFGNIDGSVSYEVPVDYAGMAPNVMNITGENSSWGWVASLDGKSFTQEATSPSGETVSNVVENSLVYSITCLNYSCRFLPVSFENEKLSIMSDEEAWIIASQDDANIKEVSVSVTPFTPTVSEKSRSGYLFAVPEAMYDSFVDSLSLSKDVDAFITTYTQYVVVEVTQKDLLGSDGFVITDANGAAVACVQEEENYEWLCSEFSITDLKACTLVPGESYTIDTRLTPAEWNKNYAFEDLEERKPQRTSLWKFKIVEGADGYYKVTLTVPASLQKTIILRLYTPQIVNIKALIIRPATNN